jgi:hypothetical protein
MLHFRVFLPTSVRIFTRIMKAEIKTVTLLGFLLLRVISLSTSGYP